MQRTVGPAHLVPDIGPAVPVVAGMRILDHPDGSVERAQEILPNAAGHLLALPSRLGGGLLIFAASGSTTQFWRARGFLDRLEPLAEVWGQVIEVVAGFDRIYARFDTGEFKAIDTGSGKQLSLEPLPRATRIGLLAFADGWRAIAVVDFRGALATFDAGNSWLPVPLEGRGVAQISVRQGDFVLENQRDRWLLGPSGELAKDDSHADPARRQSSAPAPDLRPGPRWQGSEALLAFSESYGIARRPLRAAVEDGWPVFSEGGEDSAIVAQAGDLYRIGLASGSVRQWRSDAFRPEDAICHSVVLAQGLGFVCTSKSGGTAIYAFEPPFGAREIIRYASPRLVVSSGNGGLVVRGRCERDVGTMAAERDAFCFIWPSGSPRDVLVPRESHPPAAEVRPIALRDGRAAFLVSLGKKGDPELLLSRGDGFASVPLSVVRSPVRIQEASWLEGFEEREPGVLAGWLLLGSELRGVRIHLDGKVEVGRSGAHVERTVVSGRFGLDWGRLGRGAETTDGGMTWIPIDLPPEFSQSKHPVAACGPVGCVHEGWLRVGWGVGVAPDLAPAPAPKPSRVALSPARGISLRCEPTGEVAGFVSGTSSGPVASHRWPPLPGSSGTSMMSPVLPLALGGHASPRVVPAGKSSAAPSGSSGGAQASSGFSWTPFRGTPPPSLQPRDIGLEAGTDAPVTMQARVYAWGPRGEPWARSARVQARFDDRFELHGTRASAVTGALWPDEDRAADALGLLPAHTVNWGALLDPSGQAAVLFAQQGAGRAELYGAAPGEPLVAWRSADGSSLPVPTSAVRVGPSWFFLSSTMTATTWATAVFRVDSGVARRLARLSRVPVPGGEYAPKLMRRARGEGLGLLVQGAPGFDQMIRDWYVLPLDPDEGELGDPVRLVGSDLEGQVPPRCPGDADGWMVNTDLSLSPAVRVVGPALASLSAIELRLRLGPGTVCVDAMAARAEGMPSASATLAAGSAEVPTLPLVATDSSSGRRWLLRCGPP
jgi:hypothetical protein